MAPGRNGLELLLHRADGARLGGPDTRDSKRIEVGTAERAICTYFGVLEYRLGGWLSPCCDRRYLKRVSAMIQENGKSYGLETIRCFTDTL